MSNCQGNRGRPADAERWPSSRPLDPAAIAQSRGTAPRSTPRGAIGRPCPRPTPVWRRPAAACLPVDILGSPPMLDICAPSYAICPGLRQYGVRFRPTVPDVSDRVGSSRLDAPFLFPPGQFFVRRHAATNSPGCNGLHYVIMAGTHRATTGGTHRATTRVGQGLAGYDLVPSLFRKSVTRSQGSDDGLMLPVEVVTNWLRPA
jgi:hypothetical protein